MENLKFIITAVAFALLSSAASAEIKMPKVFSDHMMFQRDEPVNVWGLSDANAKIEIKFDDKTASVKADSQGKWRAKLPALKANKTPREMIILENGKEGAKVSDILVGEVWIAGGQSNMAYGLGGMADANKVKEKADSVTVRYFAQPKYNTQAQPQFNTADDAHWFNVSSKNVFSCSAVAYTFAQNLALKLDVPVGIVQTCISGTPMMSWIPIEEFENNPHFAKQFKARQISVKNWNYEKELAKWNELVRTYPERVEKAKKEGRTPPPAWTIGEVLKPWKDSPDGYRTPAYLYNGRIAPIKGFTARGFVWYQGETDNTKDDFRNRFTGLVEIWRKLFGKPDMPFMFVQLPSFTSNNWENMRWAQFRVCRELKNMGMAVAIDTGVEKDVHPNDKLPVIERLANIALSDVYGVKDVWGYGPIFKNAQISGNMAKVNFYTHSRKIVCKGEPRGFEVQVNGKWVPAIAKLSGDSILVKSANAADKKIEGVRYLWKGWARPDVCIYNDLDIPAPSFTTETLD